MRYFRFKDVTFKSIFKYDFAPRLSLNLAIVLLSLVLLVSQIQATSQTYYNQGKGLASEQQQTGLPDHNAIPGFQGTQLPETNLSPDSIKSAAEQKVNTGHKSYKTIIQSQRERLSFHIDSKTDPLFTQSDQIANNPLETLQAITSQRTTPVVETKTRHTCEEPGAPYEMACTRELHVETIKKSKVYAYTHVRGLQFKRQGRKKGRIVAQTRGPHHVAHDAWYDYRQTTPLPDLHINYYDGCNYYPHTVKNYYTYTKGFAGETAVPITEADYNSKTLRSEDIRDHWISTCDLMEEHVDQGLCDRGERICVSGPATRLINGVKVTRECWQERQTYHCSYPARNTCGELKYKGCVQVGSRCSHQIGQTCVAYEQTYECTTRTGGETRDQFTGQVPWCLDGDCVDQGYAPNRDMAESLSKLMIFKEMQKNFNHLSIFKGKNLRCRRACVGFMNCCQKKSGWGLSVGLSDCDDKEKELSALRAKDLCVYVGTYCSLKEPVTGTCLQKKSRYCCFDSKVARLVQEQGRQQLGLNFGNAETPICRGFTIEELTRIDFEQIDLSSLFTELFDRFQTPDVSKMSRAFQQDLSTRIPKYGTDDTNHLKKLKEERDAHINVGDKDVSAF